MSASVSRTPVAIPMSPRDFAILAGSRLYDTWCVNEDAEYHEAGAEGADKAYAARGTKPVSEDQAAALASVREVPARVAPGDRRAA